MMYFLQIHINSMALLPKSISSQTTPSILLLLCIFGFIAAAVDSIAGGGGLISLPAFLLAGLPARLALGTNKFCSTSGTLMSSFEYYKNGKMNFKLLKYLFPFTLIGAVIGVFTVLNINEDFMQALVLILILFVGIFSIFSKSQGLINNFNGLTRKNIILGILLAFSIGFYDGFLGPGTGSFLIFGLISIFGFDYINASGNSKFLNLISNITALILFAIHGQVNYILAIPVAICMLFGAKLGTKLALLKGAKIIKPVFITMSLAVAVKMLVSIIS